MKIFAVVIFAVMSDLCDGKSQSEIAIEFCS